MNYKLIVTLYLLKVVLSGTVEVSIGLGSISGVIERTFSEDKEYYAFRGIPYAEPPIGGLRFLPPKPYQGCEGTYEAHSTKETCLQYSGRQRMGEAHGISGSEDCLYLSIYTPSIEGKLPVIVFDYNDHFRTSFNGTKTYSPDFFMENEVVVVTISHRLGIFGYLSTEDDIVPGNAGLKDFILGLKWIKENINNFGGDRGKVTIMGNRGGAAIADILLYSEKATGLFNGAILQSGTAIETIYFPKNPRNKAFKLGKALNITADNSQVLLEELQQIEANKILLRESDVLDSEEIRSNQMSVLLFAPTIEHEHEGAVIKNLPDHSKVINDVPLMIGLNSRESLDLVSHYVIEPRLIMETQNEFLMHFPIRTDFKFNKDSEIYAKVEREIKDFYFESGEFTMYNILEYSSYVGDMLQVYAGNYAVKKLVKEMTGPIFYYIFDFRGAFNENMEYISRNARSTVEYWGATITDELCYLFLCSRIENKYKEIYDLPNEQKEVKILKKMVRMWTNFAKSGNPTPKADKKLNGLIWEPTSANKNNYLHISKQIVIKTNPWSKRMKFWDDLIEKYSKLAVNGIVGDHDEL